MTGPFASIAPTRTEREAPMPGDDIVAAAELVMDRGFTVPGTPGEVWPWIVQLGKARGRWYLTRRLERFLPPSGRGLRFIDSRWQDLDVGDVIPDYGRDETFTVRHISSPNELVYYSKRGHLVVTWAIKLTAHPKSGGRSVETHRNDATRTRIQLRLRFAGIRRMWLVKTGGELIDLLTIAGMAAGLRERLTENLQNSKRA